MPAVLHFQSAVERLLHEEVSWDAGFMLVVRGNSPNDGLGLRVIELLQIGLPL